MGDEREQSEDDATELDRFDPNHDRRHLECNRGRGERHVDKPADANRVEAPIASNTAGTTGTNDVSRIE